MHIRIVPNDLKNIPQISSAEKNVLPKELKNVPLGGDVFSCLLSDYDNSQCEPVTATDVACQAVKVFETHMLHQIKQKKHQKSTKNKIENENENENENDNEFEKENNFDDKYNSQSVTIESAIIQAIQSNKNNQNSKKSTVQYPNRPMDVNRDTRTNYDEINTINVQKWLNNLLPECSKLDKYKLLDYSYACPYNKENGAVVYINQLYNMPVQKRKGVFQSFLAPTNNTLFKVIYSVYPGSAYYKNLMENLSTSSRLPWGIKFTEKTEILSTPQSPVFNDGPKIFYPKSMNLLYNETEEIILENDVFVILDVRTITVPVRNSSSSTTLSSEQNKSYWAILPLSKESREPEKGKKKCHRFLNTGTFQLPLFEGNFPYKYISEIVNDNSVSRKSGDVDGNVNDRMVSDLKGNTHGSNINDNINININDNVNGKMNDNIYDNINDNLNDIINANINLTTDGSSGVNISNNKHKNIDSNKDKYIDNYKSKNKEFNNNSDGGENVTEPDRKDGGILNEILSKLSAQNNEAGE